LPSCTAWEDPGCPIPVEYSREALEQIRSLAVDGLLALPRIGLGIGGLLLGTHEGGKTTILDSVTIPCNHAEGPSFLLTPEECKQALDLIRNAAPLTVVGWYSTKTRGLVAMSERDLILFDILCPEPWQMTLLIRPSTVEASRAALCFRDAAGVVRRGGEVALEPFQPAPVERETEPEASEAPDPRAAVMAKLAAANSVETSEPVDAPAVANPAFVSPVFFSPEDARPQTVTQSVTSHSNRKLDIPPVSSEPDVPPAAPSFKFSAPLGRQIVTRKPAVNRSALDLPAVPPVRGPRAETPQFAPLFQFAMPPARKPRSRMVRLSWVLLASAVVAGTGAAFFTRHDWMPLPPLHLSAADANGHLRFRWNRDAIPDIDHATLTVNDGGTPHTISLDRRQLDAGSVQYDRTSTRVDALLQAGGSTAQASYPE
jgi:hypothetical protein